MKPSPKAPPLPYLPLPDFDDDAEHYINQALRSDDNTPWSALLSDRYALQTHRVLATMREATDATFVHRNAELAKSRARRRAGEITEEQHMQALADYEEWKRRATHFRTLVSQRYRQAADAANARRGYKLADQTRATLLVLAEAVMAHREQVSAEHEPTQADRMLWLRLSSLQIPADARPSTLEEGVLRERQQRDKAAAS